MNYYISDLHFGHDNIIRFDDRPFESAESMNNALINNWNSTVSDEDTVYVLGDAFWKNEENSVRIMEQLKGHKRLIRGNHDRVHGRLKNYWESIEPYAEIVDGNKLVIASHYPVFFYKNQHYGSVMLYGHVHRSTEWSLVKKWQQEQWDLSRNCNMINVGCMMEYMNYTPQTLEHILSENQAPYFERHTL